MRNDWSGKKIPMKEVRKVHRETHKFLGSQGGTGNKTIARSEAGKNPERIEIIPWGCKKLRSSERGVPSRMKGIW